MLDTPAQPRSLLLDQQMLKYTDERTGETTEYKVSELLELVFWLKGRENTLRRMVYEFEPIVTAHFMKRVGEFMLGETRERWLVRVSIADFEAELKKVDETARRVWASTHNERIDRLTALDAQAGFERSTLTYDSFGREIYQPGTPPELVKRDPADCPYQLVYEAQQALSNPEYWRIKPQNLDMDKRAKLS